MTERSVRLELLSSTPLSGEAGSTQETGYKKWCIDIFYKSHLITIGSFVQKISPSLVSHSPVAR